MSAIPPATPGPYVPNHLVWAILSTLFCCLPLGIVLIALWFFLFGGLALLGGLSGM